MKKTKALVLSTLTAAFLVGCGGGSSSGSNSSSSGTVTPTVATQTPKFIDDVVSGIKYVNGTNSGFTNANGEFTYTSGTISFYIGNIKLGEISSIPSDKNVFIQDVVGVSRTDTSNTKVLKIASILQSLDSDNSTDAIEIKEEDFNKFNDVNVTVDENTNVSDILTSKIPSITVKSSEEITKHLENSLKQYTSISTNTTPLTLSSSSITNGAINISKDTSIVLLFNNDVKKSSINKDNIILKDTSSNSIDFTIVQEFNKVTIKPVSLSYSTSYALTLKSAIEDYSSNHLGTTDIIISFTTQSEVDTTPPTITSASTFSVNENQNSGFTVSATDNVVNSTIVYSLSGTDSSLFDINSQTGIVTFKSNPDFETKASYSVTVNAKDVSNNSSSQNVTISINDVDENAPTITSASTFSVNENQTSAFTATATDSSGIASYSLSGTDSSLFNIDSTTGVVTFKSKPDFETKSSYSVILTVIDSLNNSITKNITINIANFDLSTLNQTNKFII